MSRVLALRDGIGDVTIERLKKYAEENKLSLADSLHDIFIQKESKPEKPTRVNVELLKLATLLENYRQLKKELSPGELAGSLVDDLGIIRQYRNSGTEESLDRMNNVLELLNGISEYTDDTENASIEGFLQEVSLVTDIDNYDNQKNAVTLMTIHSAKGLEYPVVFITGLEEGLFPLMSSYSSMEEMEEERRLFYVAVTRAMQKLYMTYALTRYRFGTMSYQMKSRFLNEINISALHYRKLSGGRTTHKKTVEVEGTSIRYEYYEDAAPEEDDSIFQGNGIKKGSVVFHNNFGRGKVIDVSGKGDQKKAQIRFDKAGVKNIILKYANLIVK
jgi:DNA helicase-2/ATP-dependent DNA helicase PcrA